MSVWRRWTQEDDDALRTMARQGASIAAMAERVGRTYRATQQRMDRIGVSSERQTAWALSELRRARRLYDTGYTTREIAEVLGRTNGSVKRALDRHGGLDVKRKGAGRRRSDTRVYELRRRGLIFREVVLVLGLPDTLSRRKGMATWFRRYCARAALPIPVVTDRRSVDPERVRVERERLGLG